MVNFLQNIIAAPKRTTIVTADRMVDANPRITSDPVISYYTAGDYRPSQFYFRQLDMFVLLVLSVIITYLALPTTMTQAAGKFFLSMLVIFSLAAGLVAQDAYTEANQWKAAVKVFSMFFIAMAASLNLTAEYDVIVKGTPQNGFIGTQEVNVMAGITFACIILLAVLLVYVFWRSLLRGALASEKKILSDNATEEEREAAAARFEASVALDPHTQAVVMAEQPNLAEPAAVAQVVAEQARIEMAAATGGIVPTGMPLLQPPLVTGIDTSAVKPVPTLPGAPAKALSPTARLMQDLWSPDHSREPSPTAVKAVSPLAVAGPRARFGLDGSRILEPTGVPKVVTATDLARNRRAPPPMLDDASAAIRLPSPVAAAKKAATPKARPANANRRAAPTLDSPTAAYKPKPHAATHAPGTLTGVPPLSLPTSAAAAGDAAAWARLDLDQASGDEVGGGHALDRVSPLRDDLIARSKLASAAAAVGPAWLGADSLSPAARNGTGRSSLSPRGGDSSGTARSPRLASPSPRGPSTGGTPRSTGRRTQRTTRATYSAASSHDEGAEISRTAASRRSSVDAGGEAAFTSVTARSKRMLEYMEKKAKKAAKKVAVENPMAVASATAEHRRVPKCVLACWAISYYDDDVLQA
jgi:hypothetical protein